ncbi:Golgi resident protein GCP60-like isoform X3 [Lineus longissimus]|uniref:Golgi resident protein GCP60-like isoform X3 n=1 Tax=Lineus longissimus TaxID=88925 RepID=UPI00315CFAFE
MTETVEYSMSKVEITDETAPRVDNGPSEEYHVKWGFDLDDLYKLAVSFYKEKEGKAMHLSYKDKLKLVAYTKQVTHGKYTPDVSPDVGFLDVVGNDRSRPVDPNVWQAWQSLGDMSALSAMEEFVKTLDTLCPLFRPYILAHKTEQEEQERRRQEEEERLKREAEERDRLRLEEEAQRKQDEEMQKRSKQETEIRAALNQQTALQFQQYAEQQHPKDHEKQEQLIQQLQEQHFQQYMQQVYQHQLLHQQHQYQQLQAMASTKATDGQVQTVTAEDDHTKLENNVDGATNGQDTETDNDSDIIYESELDNYRLYEPAAASMWTRKDIKEFKESLRKDKDAMIKVGSGETVTVRVPTHEDGTCLFWEFATDNYDIGFGVYFEWTTDPTKMVSVHVTESSDEEEYDEEEANKQKADETKPPGAEGGKGDIEKGSKKDNKPPTDEIIPIYRRDCHEEVYCGSHMYPGQGVYLLKFDNSYSLWRSKYLYYRVYYTR